jgi:hypothetical protein
VRSGIHAALLYQSGWYVHWMEGPDDAVSGAMARITRDVVHSRLRVLHYSHGRRGLLQHWSMGMVQDHEDKQSFALRVDRMRRSLLSGTQHAPVSVWRRLSMPVKDGAQPGPGGVPVHARVMICSALANEAHSMASWIADHVRNPLVQHRYAGPDTPDVGLAYVDDVSQSRHLRVVAASKNGLAIDLHSALLADFSCWVLLFSGDAARDALLLRRVKEALSVSAARPAILGIATDSTQQGSTAKELGNWTHKYVPLSRAETSSHKTLYQAIERYAIQFAPVTPSTWQME